MRSICLLVLTGIWRMHSARRLDTTRAAAKDPVQSRIKFLPCDTMSCPAVNHKVTMPVFSCQLPAEGVHRISHSTLEARIEMFLSYLHGGLPSEVKNPTKPLVLGMDELVCLERRAHGGMRDPAPSVMVPVRGPDMSIATALVTDSATCFQLRLPGRPEICGCLKNKLKVQVAKGSKSPIVTKQFAANLPESCTILLTGPETLQHKKPAVLADNMYGSKKDVLCAITWNVGREYDKHVEWLQGMVKVGGVGLSGLEGDELSNALEDLVSQCGEASVVVLGLQEGAEHQLTQRLQGLKNRGKRKLIANSFAGVKPWGENIKPVGDVQGFAQHMARVVKEGHMTKYGQVLGGEHTRIVVLTTDNLLTFRVDKVDGDVAIGSPTNALEIGTPEFDIKKIIDDGRKDTCMEVTGMQLVETGSEEHRCDIVKYTLCTEEPRERDEWFTAIQLENWRSGGMVMKEGLLEVFFPDASSGTYMVVMTTDRLVPLEYNPTTGSTPREMPAIQLGTSWFRVNSNLHELCFTVSGHELGYTVDHLRTGTVLVYKICANTAEQRTDWMVALQKTSGGSAAWIVPEEHVIKTEVMTKFGQVLGFEKKRLLRLTNRRLLTNKVDKKTGELVGSPTNSLEIGTVTVVPDGNLTHHSTNHDKCMVVNGMEGDSAVEYKICAKTTLDRDHWIRAIEYARDDPIEMGGAQFDIVATNTTSVTVKLSLIIEDPRNLLTNEMWKDEVASAVSAAIAGQRWGHVEVLSITKTCLQSKDAWSIAVAVHNVNLEQNQRLEKEIRTSLESHKITVLDAKMRVISQEKGALKAPPEAKGDQVFSLPFTKGVSLAVLSEIEPDNVELFTVDFSFASKNRKSPNSHWLTRMKIAARDQILPTTADKGSAIVRMVLDGRAFCVAACHLDAGNAEKRHQQAALVADSLAALQCDATIWMGDFNTRPTDCCPWKELEFSISHGLYSHVRHLTWDHDDFSLMSQGYEEMPPLYRPTFHKRFTRKDQDECEEKEFSRGAFDMGENFIFQGASLDQRINVVNGGNKTEGIYKAALWMMNQDYIRFSNASSDECQHPSQHSVCWDGWKTQAACQKGECFNILDKSHCPGYTDRIIYKSGGILSPLSYSPIENRVEADHTPVIATFGLNIGEFNVDRLFEVPLDGPIG